MALCRPGVAGYTAGGLRDPQHTQGPPCCIVQDEVVNDASIIVFPTFEKCYVPSVDVAFFIEAGQAP